MAFTLEVYAKFLETIPDAAIVVNRHGVFVTVNSQTEQLFGHTSNALDGKSLDTLLPQSVKPFHAKLVEGYFNNPKTRAMGSGMEIVGRHLDGHEFPMDVMLKPIEIEGNQYALCVMRDISAAKAQALQLEQALAREKELALTDFLTGIPNARSFHISLDAEINRFDRFGRPFTLVYIDIDNFKIVNDEKGHAEGDKVLIEVTRVVKSHLRKTDAFARQGGDEFLLLLIETDVSAAKKLITLIQDNLNKAMQAHGWAVTFSLGVLVCLDLVERSDDLIKRADALMYEVKTHGKNDVKYSVLDHIDN